MCGFFRPLQPASYVRGVRKSVCSDSTKSGLWVEVGYARGEHNAFKFAPEFADGMKFFPDRNGFFDFAVQNVAVAQDGFNALFAGAKRSEA